MNQEKVRARDQMDPAYLWNLEDIVPGTEAWEADFTRLKAELPKLAAYEGRIGESAATLADALNLRSRLSLESERLYVYARMHRDEDNGVAQYQAMADRAYGLLVELEAAASYFTPQVLALGGETIGQWLAQEPRLATYRQYFAEVLHMQGHILSPEQERLLAMCGEVLSGPDTIHTMLQDADMQFAPAVLEDGRTIEISSGRFIPLMESADRQVREKVFKSFYGSYTALKNTLAATLTASVKGDVFAARARGFSSSLEASLYGDNVPVAVYDALIEAIHDALPSMYRYMALRKKALGVDELHMYDLYTPIMTEGNLPMDYDEAKTAVVEALAPLGVDYTGTLAQGLESHWVDVYENKGKASGAYSWGCWGVHPYVLMNYAGTVDSAFTLAHELGHAMHSYYSNSHQDYNNANYPMLLAEVASTCNEALFMQYLLGKTQDKAKRKFLINYFLEQFRTTVFRQVMFAEFEAIIHRRQEQGEALTCEAYQAIYRSLNERYYGPDMVVDEEITMEWARIPHFYNAFYVYKYATGFATAIALSQQVLSGPEGRDRYLAFLSSGGSRFPLDILKDAGIDLTRPETVAGALKLFDSLVIEMEALMEA